MHGIIKASLLGAAFALSACDIAPAPPVLTPKARPNVVSPVAPKPTAPSAASTDLARYYGRVQADLLAQGLLRVGGGGVDTPFDANTLLRNFERIAFYDEYVSGGGLSAANSARPGKLRRWAAPVRVAVEFGANVPEFQRARDRAEVSKYAARLAAVTGHTIATAPSNGANFHVLIMGEDDRAQVLKRVKQLVPNINAASLETFRTLPRSIHCLVIAFSAGQAHNTYTKAIALVRAEHPPLLRRSCIHEEMAQGLGLVNDSPAARPSIFNDDDEFALLTTHDEMLLKMLYDPRLRAGMSLSTARPIVAHIARELTGGSS